MNTVELIGRSTLGQLSAVCILAIVTKAIMFKTIFVLNGLKRSHTHARSYAALAVSRDITIRQKMTLVYLRAS